MAYNRDEANNMGVTSNSVLFPQGVFGTTSIRLVLYKHMETSKAITPVE